MQVEKLGKQDFLDDKTIFFKKKGNQDSLNIKYISLRPLLLSVCINKLYKELKPHEIFAGKKKGIIEVTNFNK